MVINPYKLLGISKKERATDEYIRRMYEQKKQILADRVKVEKENLGKTLFNGQKENNETKTETAARVVDFFNSSFSGSIEPLTDEILLKDGKTMDNFSLQNYYEYYAKYLDEAYSDIEDEQSRSNFEEWLKQTKATDQVQNPQTNMVIHHSSIVATNVPIKAKQEVIKATNEQDEIEAPIIGNLYGEEYLIERNKGETKSELNARIEKQVAIKIGRKKILEMVEFGEIKSLPKYQTIRYVDGNQDSGKMYTGIMCGQRFCIMESTLENQEDGIKKEREIKEKMLEQIAYQIGMKRIKKIKDFEEK